MDLSHASLGEGVLHRLTSRQYRNALEDLLGMSQTDLAQIALEEDSRLSGLTSIGATTTSISARGTELLEQAADQVLTRLFADAARRSALAGCDPGQATCLQNFISRFGRRAWRRPLTIAEVGRYVALSQAGSVKMSDPWAGLKFGVMALLQSPHFLYRVELGQPIANDTTRRELTPYELASRLSFFLTNRGPDDMLLDAAEKNQLSRPEDLAAQAMRLVGSPRAVAAIEHFYEDYLDLENLQGMTKDAAAFPAFNDALKAGMRAETVQTLRALTFDEQVDFRTVFTTRATYLNPDLARLYGLPVPAGSGVRGEYAPNTRAGLLMHASLLSLNSHQNSTSPTKRGKFLRETILCQSIPDPPPGAMTNLPAPTPGATMRKRLEEHVANPTCNSCHMLMDPIGLALENFDAIGKYRDNDKGAAIDASGMLDNVSYGGPLELARAVSEHERVPGCFTTTMLRQVAGDLLKNATEEALSGVVEGQFKNAKYSVRALLVALVSQPAFRYVRASEGG